MVPSGKGKPSSRSGRKICSPWREPWVTDKVSIRAAERRNTNYTGRNVSPLKGLD